MVKRDKYELPEDHYWLNEFAAYIQGPSLGQTIKVRI